MAYQDTVFKLKNIIKVNLGFTFKDLHNSFRLHPLPQAILCSEVFLKVLPKVLALAKDSIIQRYGTRCVKVFKYNCKSNFIIFL